MKQVFLNGGIGIFRRAVLVVKDMPAHHCIFRRVDLEYMPVNSTKFEPTITAEFESQTAISLSQLQLMAEILKKISHRLVFVVRIPRNNCYRGETVFDCIFKSQTITLTPLPERRQNTVVLHCPIGFLVITRINANSLSIIGVVTTIRSSRFHHLLLADWRRRYSKCRIAFMTGYPACGIGSRN